MCSWPRDRPGRSTPSRCPCSTAAHTCPTPSSGSPLASWPARPGLLHLGGVKGTPPRAPRGGRAGRRIRILAADRGLPGRRDRFRHGGRPPHHSPGKWHPGSRPCPSPYFRILWCPCTHVARPLRRQPAEPLPEIHQPPARAVLSAALRTTRCGPLDVYTEGAGGDALKDFNKLSIRGFPR